MRSETEDILIASWLIGEHLTDMEYFLPGYFSHNNNPDIVRMLQAKKDGADIFNKYHDDWLRLREIYMPSVYSIRLKEALDELPRRWALYGMGATEIAKRSFAINDRLQGVSLVPTIQRDLIGIWTKNKEELRTEGRAHYGIAELDALTGGIFPGHLTTLAGRPAEGKSALALQIASHVAVYDKRKVIYFTLEMGITEQLDRYLAQSIGVKSPYRLKEGDLTEGETSRYRDAITKLQQDGHLLFSTERIMEKIEAVIVNESPFLIVIDQLTQLQFGGRTFTNDLERYKALTRHLKSLTNTTGVSILLLCQLNRTATGREPFMQHLKDSGSIEEDSDDVLMIYKPDESNPNTRTLKVAKQRSGYAGKVEDLTFDAASCLFLERKRTES